MTKSNLTYKSETSIDNFKEHFYSFNFNNVPSWVQELGTGKDSLLLRGQIPFEDLEQFCDFIELQDLDREAASSWFPISPFGIYMHRIPSVSKTKNSRRQIVYSDAIKIDVFGKKQDYDRILKEMQEMQSN